MIGDRLAKIPRATFVRYWHHTALEHFYYAMFKKIWGQGESRLVVVFVAVIIDIFVIIIIFIIIVVVIIIIVIIIIIVVC